MTNQQIKQILISKGVTHLYHANSVKTSLTFLHNNGLISRGICEDRGLPQSPQSPQSSDNKDKYLEIYYDIFFDSVDIHKRTHHANFYGPVLFVYNIDVLDTAEEGSIKITKDNPIRWETFFTEDERYFTNVEDLRANFFKGEFKQHITIVNRHTPLSFDYLNKIILNFPNIDNPLLNQAYRYINNITQEKNIQICSQICEGSCKCNEFYSNSLNINKFFGLGEYNLQS